MANERNLTDVVCRRAEFVVVYPLASGSVRENDQNWRNTQVLEEDGLEIR